MKQLVLSNEVFSPQSFLEIVTGKCFIVNGDQDDIITIHDILIQEGYEDDDCCTVWDYPLDEIDEIFEQGVYVVLVECCYFDENDELQKEYRWIQVPDGCEGKFKEGFVDED